MPPMLAGLDEGRLCSALSRALPRSVEAVVVADGSPKPLGVSVSPVDGVELVFSGAGRTADDVIIQRLREHSSPRRVTVISSDREIRQAAGARRCRVLTSEQFIHFLCQRLQQGPVRSNDRPATEPLAPEAVAGWMEEMGLAEPGATPPHTPAPSADDPPGPLDWETLEALERELGVRPDDGASPSA